MIKLLLEVLFTKSIISKMKRNLNFFNTYKKIEIYLFSILLKNFFLNNSILFLIYFYIIIHKF
jgi:hypothetical protein